MRLTEQQKILMLQTLSDSLRINDLGDNPFLLLQKERKDLYLKILNYQIETPNKDVESIPC